MNYITGSTIKTLREAKHMTQKELADVLNMSDKTISKWETDRGLPDITIIPELAAALNVSVAELLTGDVARNGNRAGNMKRSAFYICPVCGNVLHAMGEGAFSCCGIRLPRLLSEPCDTAHAIHAEVLDNEIYVRVDHPMHKEHYISFIALLTDGNMQLQKLYPEQEAQAYFRRVGRGVLYICCNRHGLYEESYSARR